MHSNSSSMQQLRVTKAYSSSDALFLHSELPESTELYTHVLKNQNLVMALMAHFGGCSFHIPRRWPPHGQRGDEAKHPLQKVLNHEQFLRLVEHFGGTEIYIPKGTRSKAILRNNRIIQSYSKATSQGVSSNLIVRQLAQEYNLSDRRIWGILKTCPAGQHAQASIGIADSP